MDLSTLDDQWTIRQSGFDRDRANVYETLFTVGNGRLAARGAHEEGHRGAVSGFYLAGVYDGHDSLVTDLVNVPDWIDTAVYAHGIRLDADACTVVSHERALDIRHGVLWRTTVFEDGDGHQTRIDTQRTACMQERDVAVVRVEATPLNHSGTVEIVTGIDGDRYNMEALPVYPKGRTFTTEEKWAKWARSRHIVTQSVGADDDTLTLETRTIGSEVSVAVAATLSVVPDAGRTETVRTADTVRRRLVFELAEGESARLDKVVAVRTSRDVDAVADEDLVGRAAAASQAASETGVDALVAGSSEVWEQLWEASDAEIIGDDTLSQAVRFGIYHLLITANPDDPTVNIGAKSMSGEGYRGHVFWDTECVMLPFYLLTNPDMARALLGYRYHTLPGARRNAIMYDTVGARYAWESADTGDEECPTSTPDGSERFWTREEEVHVTADVAHGIHRYVEATQDLDYLYGEAAEILFDTSRFWVSFVETDDDGSVHLRQVMGPDEFHSHVDDNAFTNFLVQWHLRYAADVYDEMAREAPEKLAQVVETLGLDADAPAQWRDVADRIVQGTANDDGVIEQFAGYFEREDLPISEWDENNMPKYPEGYHHHNMEGTQLLKQPDVLELMLMFPDAFDHDVKLANFEYYEPRTLHKSSLSPSTHAVVGLTVGDRTRALQYFTRSALVDLTNNQGNTAEGMHIASAAGTWSALINGFGGLTVDHGELVFNPWVPPEWEAVRYRFTWRGFALRVEADHDRVRIEVDGPDGETLPATVAGQDVVLTPGEETVVALSD